MGGRAGRRPQDGFSLLEVVIAIAVLTVSVIAISGELTSSSGATGSSQARLLASELASQTLQQAESLGASTVGEGIQCTTGASHACTYTTSANPLTYSSGCWYYGSANAGLLVPTTTEAPPGNSDAPLIPNVSGAQSPHSTPPVVEDGFSFTVATYPMFNTTSYPSVTCSTLSNNAAENAPVTVLVVVTWGPSSAVQQVSMQTALYSPPQIANQTSITCEGFSAGSGAHLESSLSSASPSLTGPAIVPEVTEASVIALDEGPLAAAPAFCATDSGNNTVELPIGTGLGCVVSQEVCATYTYYGNGEGSTANFLSLSASSAVNPTYSGSGPNALNPPKAGTSCSTSYAQPGGVPGGPNDPPNNCNVEIEIQFTVPILDGNLEAITSVTVGVWDHEEDLDYCTWKVT